jgi:hypothetical protein
MRSSVLINWIKAIFLKLCIITISNSSKSKNCKNDKSTKKEVVNIIFTTSFLVFFKHKYDFRCHSY